MWFNEYHKACSHKFGLAAPGEYRSILQKHNRYLVVHSMKCKQCNKLDLRQRWTGNHVCACGNPYIHSASDQRMYRTEKAWREVQRKGLEVLAAKYLRASNEYSTALLQDNWTQELQDNRERYAFKLMDKGIDVAALHHRGNN